MNTGTKANVKTSSARPADWAVAKARSLHNALAAQCDRSIGQARDRLTAEIERLAAAIELGHIEQRRDDRREQRAAWKQQRQARTA